MKNYAVILDPYSNGAFYADEFKKRGIECIALLSTKTPSCFSDALSTDDFKQVLQYDGDFDKLVNQLQPYSPSCFMLGLDVGVELLDRLNQAFGLPGNDPKTSADRRNKFDTHLALKNAGLSSIQQLKVRSTEEAQKQMQSWHKWPVIVKPAESAGSDNVHYCENLEQVLAAVSLIVNELNLFDIKTEHALIQECLIGEEWVVDTVSCEGQHVAVNVSRYEKIKTEDSHFVYRSVEFLSPDNEDFAEIIDYAFKANDALGVKFGASHLEIFRTEQGPVLIEINPRVHGGNVTQVLFEHCTPVTQLNLYVDAVLFPDTFKQRAKDKVSFRQHALAHFFVSEKSGDVKQVISDDSLLQFDSIIDVKLPKKGDFVEKTTSLLTMVGRVWMINSCLNKLTEERNQLFEMEYQGELYQLN